MIRSYRIFVGRGQIKQLTDFELVVAALLCAAGVIGNNVEVEWLSIAIKEVIPVLFAVFFPLGCLMSIAAVFNTNMPDQPNGYKYLHSLENSARHFRDAILFGNAVCVAVCLCFSTLMVTFFDPGVMAVVACFAFFALGMMNFLGHTRSIWGSIIPYMLMGFAMGFYWSARDSSVFGSKMFLVIFGAVSAAVCVFGIVYAAVRAKSAWEKGSEK